MISSRQTWLRGMVTSVGLLAVAGGLGTAAAQPAGTLLVGLVAEPVNLDPPQVTDLNSLRVARRIVETLVTFPEESTQIVPGLAESWTISKDGQEPLAASLFERSIEVLREIGAENELGLSLAGYGRLRRGLGDVVKARELLTQAYEIFERLGTMHEPAKVAQQLSALPS